MSCAVQVASNCRSVTLPNAGCEPSRWRSDSPRFIPRNSAKFSARNTRNSSSIESKSRCVPSRNCASRSKGANVFALPCSTIILTRGIQSAFSQ